MTAAPDPSAASYVGRTLGEFRITAELGRGGMGNVFRAEQASTSRQVALKVIHPHLVDPILEARFAREAAAMGRLSHPNIATIHTHGEQDGILFLAMELVDGPTLRERLDELGPLPLDDVVDLFAQLAEALAHAHQAGVVHRDLKPGNVLLAPTLGRSLPKIVDFGLAKLADDGGQLTGSGRVMGSAAYMSPEQWDDSRDIDGGTDVYALGCMMYEAATAELPFPGRSPAGFMRAHLAGEPVDPARLRPELEGHPLCRWLRACLQRDRTRRVTALELWRGLGGEVVEEPPPRPGARTSWAQRDLATLPGSDDDDPWADEPAASVTDEPQPALVAAPTERPPVARRRLLLAGVVGLVAAGAVGIAAIAGEEAGPATLPTPELAVTVDVDGSGAEPPDVATARPVAEVRDAGPEVALVDTEEPDVPAESAPVAAPPVPVRLDVSPRHAVVSVDGERLPEASDVFEVPAGAAVTIEVRARGYGAETVQLSAARARALPDGRLRIALARRPRPPKPRPEPDASSTPQLNVDKLKIR